MNTDLWHARSVQGTKDGERCYWVFVESLKGNDIANVPDEVGICCEEDLQEALATARLIAAAPDMLEAIRDVIQQHQGSGGHFVSIEKLKAALEKAS